RSQHLPPQTRRRRSHQRHLTPTRRRRRLRAPPRSRPVPSFKLKLFVYFLAMGVLPLAAATWAVTRVQARTATRAADARLAAELRASLASYRRELDTADAPARRLARSGTVARRLERAEGHILFVDRNGSVVRRRPGAAGVRAIAVVG